MSGGKGEDLNGIQHTGLFVNTPGAVLQGYEFKGSMPMQGQVPKGGGAALEKGKTTGMDENNDAGLNAGRGGRQEKQDSIIGLPAMLGVGNLDIRVMEKQDSVIRSSAVEDVGDLDSHIGEGSNQEREEKWTRIERRRGKRKAEPGTTRGTWPALGGSRGDGGGGSQAGGEEEDGGGRAGGGHGLSSLVNPNAEGDSDDVVLVSDGLCFRPDGLECYCHVCFPPPRDHCRDW
jgi:hypothetical protein